MSQPRVAQGAVNRVLSFQNVKTGCIKGAGVNDTGSIQKNAVEMEIRVGNESGVDSLGEA